MLSKMNQKSISLWTLVIVFFLFSVPAFAGGKTGGDSPQAVFKAAQKAGAKKDFSTLAKLVAPSERAMLAFGADFGVDMFLSFYEGEKAAKLNKKYQKIQKKYKIKDDDGEKLQITQNTPQEVIDAHMRKRAEKKFGHVDAVKFVPEVMGIVANMPEMAEQTFIPQGKIKDVKINGNHATGKVDGESISFIKEGGRWYLLGGILD
jgi:hypothetical protein